MESANWVQVLAEAIVFTSDWEWYDQIGVKLNSQPWLVTNLGQFWLQNQWENKRKLLKYISKGQSWQHNLQILNGSCKKLWLLISWKDIVFLYISD